jgi:N-methylhydantoinase A
MRQLFDAAYGRRYGHVSKNMAIDVLMLRVVVEGRTSRPQTRAPERKQLAAPKPVPRPIWFEATGVVECDVWQRNTLPVGHRIAGPALIEEEASTTVIGPGDSAHIDAGGNIAIRLGAPA